jgi:hypothetical protein
MFAMPLLLLITALLDIHINVYLSLRFWMVNPIPKKLVKLIESQYPGMISLKTAHSDTKASLLMTSCNRS